MPSADGYFKPGNVAAVTHGARSPQFLLANRARIVQELEARLAGLAGRLAGWQVPTYDLLLDTVTQLRLVNEEITRKGGTLVTRRGGMRPLGEFWLKLHRQALAELQTLERMTNTAGADQRAIAADDAHRLLQERYGMKEATG